MVGSTGIEPVTFPMSKGRSIQKSNVFNERSGRFARGLHGLFTLFMGEAWALSFALSQ
jgi:hypothetical protein